MKIGEIRTALNVKKTKYNSHGKYYYRSAEDIFDAIKELGAAVAEGFQCVDELVLIGDRYYIKTTASYTDSDGKKTGAVGYAREALERKGMDSTQLTGCVMSYARKYAFDALLFTDDTKEVDSFDNRQNRDAPPPPPPPPPQRNTQPAPQNQTGTRPKISVSPDSEKFALHLNNVLKAKAEKGSQEAAKNIRACYDDATAAALIKEAGL